MHTFKFKKISFRNKTSLENGKIRSVGFFSQNFSFLTKWKTFWHDFCSGKIRRDFALRAKSGFTLVEMIIYLFIMTIISIAIMQSIVIVLKSNRVSFADANLRNSGYSAMETMVQQIRASKSVDTTNSILYPSSAGALQLNQLDAIGNSYVVKFATSSGQTLGLYEGSTTPSLVGPLTLSGTKVIGLIFNLINTGNSEAVRIQLNLSATVNGVSENEWFYDTIILRGSYVSS
jgi:Tfp pilus assembly protein PilE